MLLKTATAVWQDLLLSCDVRLGMRSSVPRIQCNFRVDGWAVWLDSLMLGFDVTLGLRSSVLRIHCNFRVGVWQFGKIRLC
jgi:hypothetical protein